MADLKENTTETLNPESAQGQLPERESESDMLKTAVLAILFALFIRTFFFEPFNIPSGSMYPTLLVGDYLFVSKTSYGYSRYSFPFGMGGFDGRVFEEAPKRGDVIVFKQPANPRIDYIKRLVGMPGDRIQVRNGRLYINDTLVEREPVGLTRIENAEGSYDTVMEYIETLPDGTVHRIYEESDSEQLDNTKEYRVPQNHYFLMGDNRDNSMDSRVHEMVGFVPKENLVGRAEIIFFSIDETASLYKPWTWPGAIRYSRILDTIKPVRLDDDAKDSGTP